ncbi:MAG: hypothetical protein JO129_02590 [Candidatus Dependentiae bacterium]|nr:hypothetical protein [Candidatus Dependentiae bacterium]
MKLSKKNILFLVFAFYFSNTVIASDSTEHIHKKTRTNNDAPEIKMSSQQLLSLLQDQNLGPKILEYIGFHDERLDEAQEELREAVRTCDWVTLRKAASLLDVYGTFRSPEYKGCENYIKIWRNSNNSTFLHCVANSSKNFNNQIYQDIYNSKQLKTIQELLNHGIDIYAQNKDRQTFMYHLVRKQDLYSKKNLHIIKELLRKHCIIPVSTGKSLIHAALQSKQSQPQSFDDLTPEFTNLMETLVFLGEDINKKEKMDDNNRYEIAQTPLLRYSQCNSSDLNKLLINLGAQK